MPQPVVLMVEDNPDDATLTRRAIRKNDIQCEVVVAQDGEEALAYLFREGLQPKRRPAFILLDLKLPKIGGLQVLERIKQDPGTRTIPAIIMTSSKEQRDLINCYQRGANSYILKLIDYNEFVEVIRLVAHYWLEVNVPSPE